MELLKTSAFMTAVLLSDASDFDVKALSSDSQALVGTHIDWIWRVTPPRDGVLAPSVRVTARVRLSDGASETHDLLVKETPISVQSNPRWRLSRIWDRLAVDSANSVVLCFLAVVVPQLRGLDVEPGYGLQSIA